ncbi:MAG: hypothetical protein FIA82_07950 [Melioribacter sp.]|nr:hypothetical protein [Melioribacter sp.]
MKINGSKILFLFFYIFLFSTVSFSQTVGKIYSKEEANTLFGNVIDSASVSLCDLISAINQNQNYVMFQIINGELIILGDGRKVLYPVGKNVDPNEVFALYSKSKVVELLCLSSGNTVAVEKRQSHLTVTFGLNTLEESWLCPPFCP